MRTTHGLLTCLLVTTACGKVSGLVDSRGSGDDTIDAAITIDADPHGTVKVTALDISESGAPSVGVEVLFMEPDGSLAARVRTDSDGKAQANVLDGSSVTVIWPTSATNALLETITKVKGGDDLRMYAGFAAYGNSNFSPPTTHTLNVSYPSYAGATSYYVYGSCGGTYASTNTFAQLQFNATCEKATMDVMVVAYDSSGLAGFLIRPGVTPTQGSVSLSGTYSPLSTFSATVTNVPGTVSSLFVSRYTGDSFGFSNDGFANPPMATNNLSFPVVQTTAPGFVNVQLRTSGYAFSQIYQTLGATTLTLNLDATTLLPFLDNPVLDPATGNVTTTATSADGVYAADLKYSRVVAQVGHQYEWAVLMPQAGNFTLPTLPADLMPLAPAAGDNTNAFNNTARLLAVDGMTYDQLRQDVIATVVAVTTGRTTATSGRTSISPVPN